MPLLHINADDFGLHPDIDRGILRCVDAGCVTGVSVCANGAAIDWSSVRSLATRASVGLHVTLVGEPWLTGSRHFKKWPTLLPWLFVPGRSRLLEAEIRAQLITMLDAGVMPTHLDSHQHVHIMPVVWPIVERIARAHGIARIRTPATPDRRIAKRSLAGRALQRLSEARLVERRAAGTALPCIGLAHAGHNTAARLIEELEASAGQDVELVAHPAIDTAALRARYASWHFDWTTETSALMSDAWRAAWERLNYRPPPR